MTSNHSTNLQNMISCVIISLRLAETQSCSKETWSWKARQGNGSWGHYASSLDTRCSGKHGVCLLPLLTNAQPMQAALRRMNSMRGGQNNEHCEVKNGLRTPKSTKCLRCSSGSAWILNAEHQE